MLANNVANNANIAVNGDLIIVSGSLLKTAAIFDEDWMARQPMDDPAIYVDKIKENRAADLFTFTQQVTDTTPRHSCFYEWENIAAIPLTTYDAWLTSVSPHIKEDIGRAAKRGVTVRKMEFTDQLAKDIVAIYNETPIRQGRPLPHYGKPFEEMKTNLATYPEESQFICAYHKDKLIGFIKLVRAGNLNKVMNILSLTEYRNKLPVNALIGKAIELSCESGSSHLIYGNYTYGNSNGNSLTRFKCRNGFQKILVPRYYIPLTLKGKLILTMRLHHGIRGILPANMLSILKSIRVWYHTAKENSPAIEPSLK